MSYYKHPLDHIHVGDYVVLEVTSALIGEEPYTYQVSGTVRKHDGVDAVGRNGIGEGKIIQHVPRPLPETFGSHIRYARTGVEWVRVTKVWMASDGSVREASAMAPGWFLVRDAGVKP